MQMVKVRRVGNSNVISLPRELEAQGYVPGATVVVEVLPTGELRVTPVVVARRLTPERAAELADKHHVLLDRLAAGDGAELSVGSDA